VQVEGGEQDEGGGSDRAADASEDGGLRGLDAVGEREGGGREERGQGGGRGVERERQEASRAGEEEEEP
jgi:hypothetical protein